MISIDSGVHLEAGTTYTNIEVCVREPFSLGACLHVEILDMFSTILVLEEDNVPLDMEGRAKISVTPLVDMDIVVPLIIGKAEIV